MRRHVPMALLAAGLVGPWAGMVVAAETATVDLAAPPAMAHGTALELQVTAGPLPRGARLVLMTGAGEVLGAVTPFPVGSRSSRATVPVPESAIIGGRLRLRLQVAGPGMPPRPPEPGEVQRLDLRGMPREE